MNRIKYYTYSSYTIRWDGEKCLHGGKCLKGIPPIIEKPGIYSIPVSERQFTILMSQARFCPGGALKVVNG
ncbi:MAG: (4Fe-4S)-binding protein [Bacteroidales bacterium]|nr:(4Fe-4S)-binding protein [Bacteroidales bacterium]